MDNKENQKFSKGFFKESRRSLSTKEAIINVTPFNWSKNNLKGNSKVKIVSEKINNSLKKLLGDIRVII